MGFGTGKFRSLESDLEICQLNKIKIPLEDI